MKTHVLRGSKQEIAESLVRILGDVREAIVFEEETPPPASRLSVDDIFAEMREYMVDIPNFDDSRETIYLPMDGE
jgi:hypothetical protein